MSYSFAFPFVIVGDSGVGKSALLMQLTENRFIHSHDYTIGVEFGSTNVTIDKARCKLQIWDTAGSRAFRSITKSYFKDAAGFIIVYDVTNHLSFESVGEWVEDIIERTNGEITLCLVGNKSDENRRSVTTEEGSRMALTYNIPIFFETSAKTGTNVHIIFQKTAELVYQKLKNGSLRDNQFKEGIIDNVFLETLGTEEEKNQQEEVLEALHWTNQDFVLLEDIESVMKTQENEKTVDSIIPAKYESWKSLHEFWSEKLFQVKEYLRKQEDFSEEFELKMKNITKEIAELTGRLEQLKAEQEALQSQQNVSVFTGLCDGLSNTVKIIQRHEEVEKSLNSQLKELLSSKSIEKFTAEEIGLVIWKLNLPHYKQVFLENKINGEILLTLDDIFLVRVLGMSAIEACQLLFRLDNFTSFYLLDPNIVKEKEEDCVICWHSTPTKTAELFAEYNLTVDIEMLGEWTAPLLIYVTCIVDAFPTVDSVESMVAFKKVLQQWGAIHKAHLLGENSDG